MKLDLHKYCFPDWGGIKVIEEVITDGISEAKLWPIFTKKSLKALARDLRSVNSIIPLHMFF